jgi:hypothetical protein
VVPHDAVLRSERVGQDGLGAAKNRHSGHTKRGGEAFNAVTGDALKLIFKRIDEIKNVVVLEKRPQVIDYYQPFVMPALGVLVASVLALFGLRFTPWQRGRRGCFR